MTPTWNGPGQGFSSATAGYGLLDVAEVTLQATLPGVVFATHNLGTCAEDVIAAIRDAIKKQRLNLVVASCNPRTREPLFGAACHEAGLNKQVFEFESIRDFLLPAAHARMG